MTKYVMEDGTISTVTVGIEAYDMQIKTLQFLLSSVINITLLS